MIVEKRLPEVVSGLPRSWAWAKFDDIVDTVSDRQRRIKQRDYLKTGGLPIVDQGAGMIAGYTGDDSYAVPYALPLIVFGDHTRRVKLLTQRFAVGADGVKLLQPKACHDARYIAWALGSLPIVDRGYSRHFGFLRNLHIPLPSFAEQTRIADRIDELFTDLAAGIVALQRVRKKLKRYRCAVLHGAVTGQLTAHWRKGHGPAREPGEKLMARILAERRRQWEERTLAKYAKEARTPPKNWKDHYVKPTLPKTEGLPELPEGWCYGTLDQLADVTGGVAKNAREAGGPGMRVVPYLRVANVQRGYLDLADVKTISASEAAIADLRLVKGDVLFTEGGDRDKLGRGWVWAGEIEECIHQNHIFRARLFVQDVCPTILSFAGNSYGQSWFRHHGKQSVNLASISLGVLRQFPIPIVPIDEQSSIVEAVNEKLSQIDAMEAEVERGLIRADRLQQAILQAAFAGQLVPQDPADEPATVLLERIRNQKPTSGRKPLQRLSHGRKKTHDPIE